jgi:hypothetical protein
MALLVLRPIHKASEYIHLKWLFSAAFIFFKIRLLRAEHRLHYYYSTWAGMILIGWFLPMLLAKCGSLDGVEHICQSRSIGGKDRVQWFWAQHNWNFFGTALVLVFSGIYCIKRPYKSFVKDNDILLDRKRKLQSLTNPSVLRNVTHGFLSVFYFAVVGSVLCVYGSMRHRHQHFDS